MMDEKKRFIEILKKHNFTEEEIDDLICIFKYEVGVFARVEIDEYENYINDPYR